ncbi:cell wall-binding repeat-containing protein [Agromyces albus]|uniref:Cell wall-binding repeat-containing protein n=1 Tax=Agromyces albus TaxID=205332 RepID=A0A4Q2L4E2_9MICO|nr:cell wall-binding repeat-containing protein [Agromyces albus]RXZ71730.1 cell wall-binding repeat-containing protein [Agromyces albus]
MTLLSIWQPSAAMASEIAPNLVSLHRTSADVVAQGDDVVVAWEFDAPVEYVSVILRDSLDEHQHLHGGSGAMTSGEARATVDTSIWPGGSIAFAGIRYAWTTGEKYYSVELDATGAVVWKSEGLAEVPSAGQAIDVVGFDVTSDIDLSIPAMLVSATRTSGDVLADGEAVEIAWEFDRPMYSVVFRLRDSIGRDHRVEWSAWNDGGSSANAGIARAQVDTPAWAGGEVVFSGIEYSWSGGSMSLDGSGTVNWKQPTGLADATLPASGLGQLTFVVDSAYDPGAAPLLTSLTRTSPDVVRNGDEVWVEWAFDSPVDSVWIMLRDSLGGVHSLSAGMWNGAAESGRAYADVDTARWPAGKIELEQIQYNWGSGAASRSVTLDANGELRWTSGDTGEIPPATAAISYTPFTVESDIDLSIPPTLSSASLLSPEVVTDGGELQVAWSFDRPVESVQVYFRDAVGQRHAAYWTKWATGEPAATEGVARWEIDTATWAGGETVFDGIHYEWGNSWMALDATGAVTQKSPPGVADAVLPSGGLAGLAFTVDSDVDLAAVPSLTSVTRVSGDVIHDGEGAAIGWEFDAPVQWVSFAYLDGLGRQVYVMWNGEPATSGVASVPLEGATWAPGVAELVEVRYSFPGDHTVTLSRDGTRFSKWPSGIDDPVPYEPGFAALDFAVETDAVFETVTVPAPVFTDATCEAGAHVLLEDFPHGSWNWNPNNGMYGDGGESYDGEPWRPNEGVTYTVTARFDDGWGTTGESRWTHEFVDPGSCEPLLEFPAPPTPTIIGDPVVGSMLMAVPGDWQPAPVELSFQWTRDGLPIAGATETSYEPSATDAGTAIAVEVIATKEGYQATTRASEPVLIQEASEPPSAPVSRVAGADRFATAVAVSKEQFEPGVEVVYVANGLNFPDALAAGPVAALRGGPVLLVAPWMVPEVVKGELERLQPKRIVVLGGENSVNPSVAADLGGYASEGVSRVAGADRFATAVAVSKEQFEPGVEVVYVANGLNFPDALAAGPVAALRGGPVLLVAPWVVPEVVKGELERLQPKRIVVLGGENSVNASVAIDLGGFVVP